ncbi:nucleotide sugar dehydrogenase [Metallumcola ferriviriculae]|uniref:Nucleotide sugar dehydrogenase n=1 Tax=Metallumcola ferriviriculae TaxID=3039180 RepID=A0AAU0UM80_9FIRM|nr:nucleotide sugar dehydrogenase [Desulfitibacteraceae bacterium MK1]
MLKNKVFDYSAQIGVIGLGYVGLPLAHACVKSGYSVMGIDTDLQKVAKLNKGQSYIADLCDADVASLFGGGKFSVSSHYGTLKSCDIIFICVPTPLNKEGQPDYNLLFKAVESTAEILSPSQLIVVESTVAPQTTEKNILPRLSKKGLLVGEDFFLAYSPERIDPGNSAYNLANTPKLVAGVTENCTKLTQNIYEQLGMFVVTVSSPAVAEMAKILENTYRDVNIALVNEMAQICSENGIDIWEVVSAAATKPYGYQAFYPGPGVGGHCIPVDSVYYTDWAQNGKIGASLVRHARDINAAMSKYVVDSLSTVLLNNGRQLSGSKVLVLGVTYKRDINDQRESPAVKLIELLSRRGALVSYHDPYVEEIKVNGRALHCSRFDKRLLNEQDCVVMAVAHKWYDLRNLSSSCALIFDLTNVTVGLGYRKNIVSLFKHNCK